MPELINDELILLLISNVRLAESPILFVSKIESALFASLERKSREDIALLEFRNG